jgi:hypothetical protein
MTYYQAALRVLEAARRPLSTREITTRAIQRKLIEPGGKTPHASMSAALYKRLSNDPRLVKVAVQGTWRAQRGSVRWALRRD